MINKGIIEAFKVVAKEKGIDSTNLSSIIEDLFVNLIKKRYGEDYQNFNVIVNMEKGEIEIYQEMTVVKDMKDPIAEIQIEEARKEYDDLLKEGYKHEKVQEKLAERHGFAESYIRTIYYDQKVKPSNTQPPGN